MSATVRIPSDLLAEIDAHQERISTRWRPVSRSDAVRDLIGLGLAAAEVAVAPSRSVTSLNDVPLYFVPLVPEEDEQHPPFSPLWLSGERRCLNLTSWPYAAPGNGRILDLAYEPISGAVRSPRIDGLRIGGGADLLPYEGPHPLSAWEGSCLGAPRRPRLRSRARLVAPNRGGATVLIESDALVHFRLFVVVASVEHDDEVEAFFQALEDSESSAAHAGPQVWVGGLHGDPPG